MKELLFADYVRVDKGHEFSTEISIDFIAAINKPGLLSLKTTVDEKKWSQLKKFQRFYFRSIEAISYSSTSNFNFYINNLAFHTGEI